MSENIANFDETWRFITNFREKQGRLQECGEVWREFSQNGAKKLKSANNFFLNRDIYMAYMANYFVDIFND